jgi:hypothetical protein
MARVIQARNFIGSGSPASNGERLADVLLEQDSAGWDDVVIDARECPPEYLGSALFHAFWQRISERQPNLQAAAKSIRWEFAHPFQRTTFELLRSRFKPRQTA